MHAATADDGTSTSTGLAFLWLEITNRCNLTCSHCYAESGPTGSLHGEMGRADWLAVIQEAADLGCRSLQFIGGEPTLHPDLPALIGHARRAGFARVEVFTNATRVDADLVGCFQSHGVDVACSFYSDDCETHAQITGSRDSWRRTVAGIRAIVAAGLNLRVGVIEMEQNAGHLGRTRAFLNSLGVRNVGADHRRAVGRGGVQDVGRRADNFGELCGRCWQGRLCVTASGIAYPCVFARAFPMGDARCGLAAILVSAELADFRRRLPKARGETGDAGCHPDCRPNFCYPDMDMCRPNEPEPDCGPVEPRHEPEWV